jgi:hypothetical protein
MQNIFFDTIGLPLEDDNLGAKNVGQTIFYPFIKLCYIRSNFSLKALGMCGRHL